ncbi:RecQ family ATP-dependent DNA helicase [Rhodopirellula sp. P2]|uniref:RecQ family ATP-dependent DNA helicase n=1 Tax=Rhodopirellula sp. P2 TaxID=2127060 RepID=UPI0023685E1C|nr:RecQ family ATP-dependent DNA helicase [Rhodopirellula sp. P2]WDQ17899.1 RecQ family ATP-dependent DNA helicase [Rhodopirellula sp. P2]
MVETGTDADDALPDSSLRSTRWAHAERVLKESFGFERLLPPQRKVMERLFDGRNVVAVMPTGSGKSLCYQLVSQCLPHLTVVVSPLVALMKDQGDSLKRRGIEVARLDHSASPQELRLDLQRVRSGHCKLLYVSPERFFNERFRAVLGETPISMLAVDEAHCMSEWGHHFRPDYLRLPDVVEEHSIPQVLALTATAPTRVVREIRSAFGLERTDVVKLPTHRSNLHLQCTQVTSRERDERLLEQLRAAAKSRTKGVTIVYVTRRRTAEQLAESLNEAGLSAMAYHAGLTSEQRNSIQHWFLESNHGILVGTVAFGMGVDKANVRRVIHYNPSSSLEGYSQEIGRGGRDGKATQCQTWLVPEDQVAIRNLPCSDWPTKQSVERLLDRLIGQPDSFYLALGKLAWEVNLSVGVLGTFMIQLRQRGCLELLPARYDVYRVKPRCEISEIASRSGTIDPEAAEAIVASLVKAKRAYRVNLVLATRQYGVSRIRLVAALEELALSGIIELESSELMHGYRWVERIARPAATVKHLLKRFDTSMDATQQRIDSMMGFLACSECLPVSMAAHFGSRRSRPCGKCSACRGEGPWDTQLNPPDSIGDSASKAMADAMAAYPDLFSDPIDRAKFLCGLYTPAFMRFRVNRHFGFGVCESVPFTTVLAAMRAN